MWAPLSFSKLLSHARTVAAGLGLLAVCTLASGAAASTIDYCVHDWDPSWTLPGISLADLVNGDEFKSLDGELKFSGFSANIEGHAIHNPEFYRVLPTEDGFKLFSPLVVAFDHDAQLTLDYKVETVQEELIVKSVSLSFLGCAFGSGADARVDMNVGDLSVYRTGPFNQGQSRDHKDLQELLSQIHVSEGIRVQTDSRCWFHGLAAVLVVDRRFEVAIPEPTTALLVTVGLVGLARRRRRRGG